MSSSKADPISRYVPHPDPPDQVFSPNERLFLMVSAEHVENNRVTNLAIRLPSSSVDREKYKKLDEIRPSQNHPELNGIAAICVRDLPEPLLSPGDIRVEFGVVHVPYIDNYAHSEIRVKRLGEEYKENWRIKGAFRKTLRDALAERMCVAVSPKPIYEDST